MAQTTRAVPSLSEDGWIFNTPARMDQLFSDFFLSDYSQSDVYAGQVTSFPWIYQEFKDNELVLRERLQVALITYFSRYGFNVTDCYVSIEYFDATSSKQNLSFFMTLLDESNELFNLATICAMADGKVQQYKVATRL